VTAAQADRCIVRASAYSLTLREHHDVLSHLYHLHCQTPGKGEHVAPLGALMTSARTGRAAACPGFHCCCVCDCGSLTPVLDEGALSGRAGALWRGRCMLPASFKGLLICGADLRVTLAPSLICPAPPSFVCLHAQRFDQPLASKGSPCYEVAADPEHMAYALLRTSCPLHVGTALEAGSRTAPSLHSQIP
jgi:hypothetical protein